MRSKIASAYGSGESSGNGKRLMSATSARSGRAGTRGSTGAPTTIEPGLRVDLGRVQLGHVERVARGQPDEPLAARHAGAPQRRRLAHQPGQRLLALADEERVDERRQRLRVRRGRTARDDQRPGRRRGRALRSGMPDRSSTLSTLVYVSSYCSENPITSNSASGVADSSVTSGRPRARSSASQSSQGANARSQAMSSAPVEHAVQDLRPEVRHPDLVDVGEHQADARRDGRGILAHLLILAADVARRLLDLCSGTPRTDAAWLHAPTVALLVTLEHEGELGPVLFRRLREHPALHDLLDAGLEQQRNCVGPSRPTCLTRPEMPIDSFTDSLPCVRLLSRVSARW